MDNNPKYTDKATQDVQPKKWNVLQGSSQLLDLNPTKKNISRSEAKSGEKIAPKQTRTRGQPATGDVCQFWTLDSHRL